MFVICLLFIFIPPPSAPLIDPFNGEGSRPYSQTKNNLLRQQANALSNTGLLPESVIWSYIIQVTVAQYIFLNLVNIFMLPS